MLYKLGFREESVKSFIDSLELINKTLLKFRKSIINELRLPKDLKKGRITELLINKGFCHQRLHQYNEALECYNEALKFNPEQYYAPYNKGYILAILGQI